MNLETNPYIKWARTPRSRHPLGKINTENSYRLKGADTLHILVKDEKTGEWRLKCAPDKIADYNYTGFLKAVGCTKCTRGMRSGDGSATEL